MPFLITPFAERTPAFSPDGRWVTYYSNESGRYEVYVRPFPGPGGKWQISTGGGRFPSWSPNGKELFYRTLDSRIMVVTYSVEGDSFRAGRPRPWSEGQFTERGSPPEFRPSSRREALRRAQGARGFGADWAHPREVDPQLVRRGPPPRRLRRAELTRQFISGPVKSCMRFAARTLNRDECLEPRADWRIILSKDIKDQRGTPL